MLGIKSERTVIKGEFAKKIREALRRKYENDPSEEDIKAMERSKKIRSQYRAIWIDDKDKLKDK